MPVHDSSERKIGIDASLHQRLRAYAEQASLDKGKRYTLREASDQAIREFLLKNENRPAQAPEPEKTWESTAMRRGRIEFYRDKMR